MRPLQFFLSACCRKRNSSALISSLPVTVSLHHAHQHAHRPLGARLIRRLQVSNRSCYYHSAHHFRFMAFVLFEPYFPAASTRIHHQSSYRIISKGDRFPESFRANSGQKPVALFRRFVRVVWNPCSFLIAITLIVSVTASQRAPQLGRIFLLLPLDSPLSEKSDVAERISCGSRPRREDRTFGFGCLPFPFLCPYNIINSAQRQAFFAQFFAA